MSVNHVHPCGSDFECSELYSCLESMCHHKAFWPPTLMELMGMLFIGAFSGFASLAGIGGGGVMVSFLTFFFNYSQKEALLIVFVPIFGAACGNFLNLMRQTDPITKTPVVMIRSAILACPVMIIGSVVGLMINKLLPAFFLVLLLEYFIGKSLIKFYLTAKKEWHAENERKLKKQLEMIDLGDPEKDEDTDVKLNLSENIDVVVAALIIVATVVTGFVLRGSKDIHSIIGFSYCGVGYWVITLVVIGLLYKYFYIIDERFNISNSPAMKQSFLINSLKAGIINGFGLGGGMFLIPMYLGFNYTAIQSTGTSSFNVLLSSFQAASQIVILGLIKPMQALQLFLLTLVGCYASSSFIFTTLKAKDRLSIIMWGLCGFCIFAMCGLMVEFLSKWSQNHFRLLDLVDFQSVC